MDPEVERLVVFQASTSLPCVRQGHTLVRTEKEFRFVLWLLWAGDRGLKPQASKSLKVEPMADGGKSQVDLLPKDQGGGVDAKNRPKSKQFMLALSPKPE
jgi:hypothetical protein